MSNIENLQPAVLVIFGVTGDLSKRKVLPALYHLWKDGLLPEGFQVIGTSRREITADELLKDVELCVLEDDGICEPEAMANFRSHFQTFTLDPSDDRDYIEIKHLLDEQEAKAGTCLNRLYYLSIPPQVYAPIIRQMGKHGLQEACEHGNGNVRLLVEKPFGHDLASAEALIQTTHGVFTEEQVYRIDHYLAKETAQNILAFRKYNPMFEHLWKKEHITGITVEASEKIDIEGRGNFYDSVGAMRDLIQSHLLQLAALVLMDLPEDIQDANAIHKSKARTLQSLTGLHPDLQHLDAHRAQYEGYPDEAANPGSPTETFAALTVWSREDRWQGVPLMLITGKALAEKLTEIRISFKAPHGEHKNTLTFRLQPHEGISVDLLVKRPGFTSEIDGAHMEFDYETTFNQSGHPDAYERVLIDAIKGDPLLFASSDEVLSSWHILQPILSAWQHDAHDLTTYPKGIETQDLLKQLHDH